MIKQIAGLWCGLALLGAGAIGQQGQKQVVPDFRPEHGVEWKEMEAPLPPPPLAGNLVPFSVSTSSFSFALDRASLTLGEDRIARYTLVLTSKEGARNVTYEALRCATGERKTYAFGRADGSWAKAPDSGWRGIRDSLPLRHYYELYTGILCRDGAALSPPEILNILRLRH